MNQDLKNQTRKEFTIDERRNALGIFLNVVYEDSVKQNSKLTEAEFLAEISKEVFGAKTQPENMDVDWAKINQMPHNIAADDSIL